MARFKYEFLSGEDFATSDADPQVLAFIKRLQGLVDDPTVNESGFVEVLHGLDNPLLDKELMPGRACVTRAVFANPLYHVMNDILGRKRIAIGSLDMDAVRERYSMTVKEAAAKLGLHENAIRQAIAARRLASVKVKGEHRLDPAHIANYKTSPRGRPAPLVVVYGSTPGARLSFKTDGELVEDGADGAIKRGHVEGWTTAKVLAGSKEKVRFWRLEPGPDVTEIGFSPFSVKGRFTVVELVNNAAEARATFKDPSELPAGLELKLVVKSPMKGYVNKVARNAGDVSDPPCPSCGARLRIRPVERINYECEKCKKNLVVAPQ